MPSAKVMIRKPAVRALAALLFSLTLGVPHALAANPDEQRAAIQSAAQATLEQLYAVQPKARKAIAAAAGYGVFSELSTKILLAGGGGGKGVVVDKVGKQQTYMLMATLQAGYGMGITKTHLVWVFEHERDLKDFIANGYQLGTSVNLQVNPGTGGGIFDGAVEVEPGIWLYQLSDAGLALDLTVEGTKYFKDPNLN